MTKSTKFVNCQVYPAKRDDNGTILHITCFGEHYEFVFSSPPRITLFYTERRLFHAYPMLHYYDKSDFVKGHQLAENYDGRQLYQFSGDTNEVIKFKTKLENDTKYQWAIEQIRLLSSEEHFFLTCTFPYRLNDIQIFHTLLKNIKRCKTRAWKEGDAIPNFNYCKPQGKAFIF